MPSPESRVDLAQAADALASEVDRLLDHGRVDGDWTDLEGALDSLRSALRASTEGESARVEAARELGREIVARMKSEGDYFPARVEIEQLVAALEPAPTSDLADDDLPDLPALLELLARSNDLDLPMHGLSGILREAASRLRASTEGEGARVEAALEVIRTFSGHGREPDVRDDCGLHFRIEDHYQALLDKLVAALEPAAPSSEQEGDEHRCGPHCCPEAYPEGEGARVERVIADLRENEKRALRWRDGTARKTYERGRAEGERIGYRRSAEALEAAHDPAPPSSEQESERCHRCGSPKNEGTHRPGLCIPSSEQGGE